MTDKDKPQGKVEIKIGNMSFMGEGDQEWLSEQVTKIMEAAAKTGSLGDAPKTDSIPAGSSGGVGPLASYIKAKGGENKQVQRFLATAAWLYRRDQATNLSPKSVAKALTDHHQKKLGNPADCLNQNVSKGYCEKKNDGSFFITPDGWKTLGEQQ